MHEHGLAVVGLKRHSNVWPPEAIVGYAHPVTARRRDAGLDPSAMRSVAWSVLRLGCRAPRLVKFSKRPERDRQLRRPYFKRSNSTFPKQHTDKRLSAVFPNFDGAPDLVLCIKAVPDHFDREFPRFRFKHKANRRSALTLETDHYQNMPPDEKPDCEAGWDRQYCSVTR